MASLISADDLSTAWARSLELLVSGTGTTVNLNVSFPGGTPEDPRVRERLDLFLESRGTWSVQTVANTIFPADLYPSHLGADAAARLYEVYALTMPFQRRRDPQRWDTYFNRLVAYPGPKGQFNQLDYVIGRLRKQQTVVSPNSSAYELGLSDPPIDSEIRIQAPAQDRNLYGFPCLSHISLTLDRPRLSLTATYRNQTFIERAYGNYLGLSRLLDFLCDEISRDGPQVVPGEIQCTATHASAQFREHGKSRVTDLCWDVHGLLAGQVQEALDV